MGRVISAREREDILTRAAERRKSVLRDLRLDGQFTQRELARAAGVSAATVSQIEKGVLNPTWQTITRLARALGIEPELICARREDGPAVEAAVPSTEALDDKPADSTAAVERSRAKSAAMVRAHAARRNFPRWDNVKRPEDVQARLQRLEVQLEAQARELQAQRAEIRALQLRQSEE